MCTDDEVYPVRLVGGSSEHEGRVEIYRHGEWGTICDDDFDEIDGSVICRELGFPAAVSVSGMSFYGEGTGAIWLDNLMCNGSEYAIEDCPHPGLGVHNCNHSEDAGVLCDGELRKKWFVLWFTT